MRRRCLAWMGTLIVVMLVPSLTAIPAAGQDATSASKSTGAKKTAAAPKTPWGDPDLQGVWNASGATPMERPAAFAGRAVLKDEEIARLNGEDEANADRPPRPGDPGAYNDFWFGRGKRTRQ